MAKALYPGSFDPFHLGHLDVVERVSPFFDEVIVGVLGNPGKRSGLLSRADRVGLAEAATAHLPNVRCLSWDGLTIELACAEGASFLVRCAHKDFHAERTMAAMNETMSDIRTVFAVANPTLRMISSSLVRDLVLRGEIEAALALVPRPIAAALAGAVRSDGAIPTGRTPDCR